MTERSVTERESSIVRGQTRLPRALVDGAEGNWPGVPIGVLIRAGLWLLGPDADLEDDLVREALSVGSRKSGRP